MDKKILIFIVLILLASVYYNVNPSKKNSEIRYNSTNSTNSFIDDEDERNVGLYLNPSYISFTDNYGLFNYTTEYDIYY